MKRLQGRGPSLYLNIKTQKSERSYKMGKSFVAPLTIIRLLGKNAVEVRLTKEFSRKHPIFSVSLAKQYHQLDDEIFRRRKKITMNEKLLEEDDTPGPVKKIIKARKIRINWKDNRQ
ncbi:hypothetical protein O181_076914 [Austropuccinia psidii MF-1]|uniref:Uncharacterized protein n=1 Tax=Austropuccinia psidii MF-1 TaxID=1389203 RepID=A0A9Q3FDY9_9BASI|nr:hypothetical protein [Austropuccinia psidii MF-1]